MTDQDQPTPEKNSSNVLQVQRDALRDLMRLCTDSAAEEIQIEAKMRSLQKAAARQHENENVEVEAAHQKRLEEIETEYNSRVAAFVEQFEKAMSDLAGYDDASHRQLEHQSDSVSQEIQSKVQQAVWLADSMLEATQNQLNKVYTKEKETHGNRLEEIEKLNDETTALLAWYGQPELAKNGQVIDKPADAPATDAKETNVEPSAIEPPPIEPGAPATEPPKIPKYDEARDALKQQLSRLENLQVPRLFVGIWPFVISLLICALSVVVTQIATGGVPKSLSTVEPKWIPIAYAFGGAIVFCGIVGLLLRMLGRSQVRRSYAPVHESLKTVQLAADQERKRARVERDSKLSRAVRKRDAEVQATRAKYTPQQQKALKNRTAALSTVEAEVARRVARVEEQQTTDQQASAAWKTTVLEEAHRDHEAHVAAAQSRHSQSMAVAQKQHDQQTAELRQRWTVGLSQLETPITQAGESDEGGFINRWDDPRWSHWAPPKLFPTCVRFGDLRVDLPSISEQCPKTLPLPPASLMPASLCFPSAASVLIHTDHASRENAVQIQQMLMARLLTQLPAGRVRFTLIDPLGLGQNFAGFMRLADHDESIVGGRIWTETEQIEQQLANLTEHMETVIQKYLRNEFKTIDEYNAQAGELAEPYRYLVIADFPTGFDDEACRRLNSIASSGARCGVFYIIMRDTRQQLPSGANLDELQARGINLVGKQNVFAWRDEVFKQFALTLDPPPNEETLTRLLDIVGREAKRAKRVEVPFDSIAPAADALWTRDSRDEIQVPIGRLGATRLQTMRIGRGVAQHALIAGKTGSGKSTLLHVLITNIALWYGPDQVEFYLVDFKKGVEFKTYAEHLLPHARAIAVESEREFGISVLQRLDAELIRRGELFRKAGAQDLASYRQATGLVMPRTLLVIDEFQEFFSEDDRLAQEASLLLDRLVRQGRAFGIHVLLGSQTIGGTSGLSRSTLGQMAIRVALQTSEADSQLILGDSNSAARLLSRPGEAIYNDAGGMVENNSPFQISWLSDAQREKRLEQLAKRANKGSAKPIIFEGNAPAHIAENVRLNALLAGTAPLARPTSPLVWLGDPVAIKDPTSVAMRPQSGAHMLVIGQQEEAGIALLAASMISLAAQHPKGTARFYLFDGTPADSNRVGAFAGIAKSLHVDLREVDWRDVATVIEELAAEVKTRAAESGERPAIYIMILGIQRYRMLRKAEDSFSFSSEEKKPQPDQMLAEILREGPAVGVHVLGWIDTAASIERTFDRTVMREFDYRILFQMSATDSSNLIDSPTANKIGVNRALSYSEELGITEKFRPYALPDPAWLDSISKQLAAR